MSSLKAVDPGDLTENEALARAFPCRGKEPQYRELDFVSRLAFALSTTAVEKSVIN